MIIKKNAKKLFFRDLACTVRGWSGTKKAPGSVLPRALNRRHKYVL